MDLATAKVKKFVVKVSVFVHLVYCRGVHQGYSFIQIFLGVWGLPNRDG